MSVAADYAQVNARVRPELKKSGEAALANAGYTPTKAIRLLYAFASEHASSPQAIADYLEGAGAAMGRRDAPTDAQAEKLEAMTAADALVQGFLARYAAGTRDSAAGGGAAEADYREQELVDRYGEDWWRA